MNKLNHFMTVLALGGSMLATACDDVDAGADSGLDEASDRAPLGKADRTGSCMAGEELLCGGKSDGACWCDENCSEFGDCCSDFGAVCECVALTCEPMSCGVFEDGCGGTLDCGPCEDPFALDEDRASSNFDDLLGLFSPGTSRVEVGEFSLRGRQRSCQSVTGCSAWSDWESPTVTHTRAHGAQFALPSSGETSLRVASFPEGSLEIIFEAPAPGGGSARFEFVCGDIERVTDTPWLDCHSRVRLRPGVAHGIRFRDTPSGREVFDSGSWILWRGRIYEDGHYQFVSELGGDTEAIKNQRQLAITGVLPLPPQ